MISVSLLLLLLHNTLSQEVIPIEYDITVTPELSDLSFTSEVTITILVEEPVQNVTLNSKNLQIQEPLTIFDYSTSETANVTFSEEDENLILQFTGQLETGLYDIFISYSGTINEDQEGLYVSQYTKQNDTHQEDRLFVLTNFHYDKARQVFPCFDTPTLPSTFIVHIVRPNDYIAVSNMVRTSEEEINENKTKDTFAKTEVIPTYMLSFAIIDFTQENYEDVTVYSLISGETEYLGQFSADVSTKFQEIEAFKLTHLSIVVVPDDALPGDVLDNAGLIFYRESAVLYNQDRETLHDKQEISKLVARSTVRQWYKNQESFKWWPNFWATEGITVSYQYSVLDALLPTWRLDEQFLIEELDDLLEYDVRDDEISLILPESETPDSYSEYHRTKAFGFVRMFSNLPQPADILEDEDNIIALSWIQAKGYPILRVTRDYSNNLLTFAQSGTNKRPIPINLISEDQDDTDFSLILEEAAAVANLSSTLSSSWHIVNSDRLGYFRTSYGTRNWKTIDTLLLNSETDISIISPTNRAILISDSYYLAELGNLNYSLYLELVRYLPRENDYLPLSAFIRSANRLKTLLAETETQELFIIYARQLLQHLYNSFGTSNNPHIDSLTRTKILTWLCDFGHKGCQTEMYATLSSTPQSLQPDAQEPVYCGGMRLGSLEEFGFLKDEYNIHKKERILRSMACTSDTELLQYLIRAIVDQSAIIHLDPEHKLEAFNGVIEGSDAGVDVALAFLKQYLEQILAGFAEEEVSTMFTALSKKLVTEEQATTIDEIIECLNEAQNETYRELFESVKNNINFNIAWRNSHVQVIDTWLKNNLPSSTILPPEQTSTAPNTSSPVTEPSIEPSTTPAGASTISEISLFTALMYLILHYVVNNWNF